MRALGLLRLLKAIFRHDVCDGYFPQASNESLQSKKNVRI